MGDKPKVVWAEFSTLKLGRIGKNCMPIIRHHLEVKTRPRLRPVSLSFSMGSHASFALPTNKLAFSHGQT